METMNTTRNCRTVWMIIASYEPLVGGAERQAQALSEHLIKQGWVVQVITRRHHWNRRYSGLKTETIRGVRVFRSFSRGRGQLGAMLYITTGLWFILRHARRRDIFYAQDIGAPAWLALAASLLFAGISIVKIRSERAAYYQHRWRALQFKWLSRIVSYFVAVSEETCDVLSDHGVSAERIVLLPNGVNSVTFRPATNHQKMVYKQALALPLDKIIIVSVGRLIQRKSYDLLVLACAELPEQILEQLCIVIVGDGPEKEKLLKLAHTKNVHNFFRFVGHQDDLPPFYSAADFFVLQSWGEGLSNAVLEAMACGLPVICSDVGGARSCIQHELNGLLIPPKSVDALKNALINMISRSDEWQKMGAASRQIVERKFALDITSQNFSRWLESIIK